MPASFPSPSSQSTIRAVSQGFLKKAENEDANAFAKKAHSKKPTARTFMHVRRSPNRAARA
ncbi:hypothetical protein C1879_10315 [Paraeggerthella hongkongensis]|nr:hypothetical protein C1879_10315 [Paraeggerthella hongkongensis]